MQQPFSTVGLRNSALRNRIESIDILRGIAMIIMALDHVRDYFHLTANTDDPLNLDSTSPFLFFTRWITHFCAPIFIFLTGTSIYLQSLRKTKKALSVFLIKRGFWLIFIEIAVISLAWTFNPHYNFIPLQVIWAIGICMVLLGFLLWLPYKMILFTGLAIVFLHNLLDIPESAPGFSASFWWDLMHSGFFKPYPFFQNHYVIIVYPFVPWLGLMLLGYCTGALYSDKFTMLQRRKILINAGLFLILLLITLRFINIYGDPQPWQEQKNGLYSFLSFINFHKYPPSLLFMCAVIGPGLLLLAILEKVNNKFTSIFRIYGRVAFFYYILHLYLIHLLAVISFFANGHSLSEAANNGKFPFYFVVPGEGYGLAVVYAVWLFVLIALYPLCAWYNRYKSAHKEKWWLSYL